ncbi:uncharacterized protein LOC130713428 [Lotus japonicus]|uniref:uncharacterized protein LOC130713428 n=1 Tax=Lotus japonicus TaxID=34305 RepID=UPI00258DF570|nr:uncharacterized protein LOC130713428 [Lotus japonicus]
MRFAPNSLWCRVVSAIYSNGSCTKESAWWKDVKVACGGEGEGWFQEGILKHVRAGNATKFWLEDWSGVGILRERYFRLYNLSRLKGAFISDCGVWVQGVWNWKFEWRRPIVGREVLWLQNLISDLAGVRLVENSMDKWTWSPSPDGVYSVNSSYSFLQVADLAPPNPIFNLIWHAAAPSSVVAFARRCILDRIPCFESLLKRHVISSYDAAVCLFCQKDIETSFHLLFSCTFALDVWYGCLNWLGISSALPMEPRAHLLQFRFGSYTSHNQGLMTIWLAGIWTLWLSRNAKVFRQEEAIVTNALELIKLRSWQWIRTKITTFGYSIFEWYSNPLLCIQCM